LDHYGTGIAKHARVTRKEAAAGPGLRLGQIQSSTYQEIRMNRKQFLKSMLATAAVAGGMAAIPALAEDTIKVGVLHSLSGTMAISETALKNTVLMTIEEINAKGGVLGKKLEAVIVDPASNWPLFAEKARQLITQDKVAAVFGCWTSVSRKSVLPVFEELNSLLFYRCSTKVKNCRRTCSTPARRRISKRFRRSNI
jgi:ABC-type branched-subunit amino acid transport system substrate-binding protein